MEAHDSLPYIDADITQAQREAALVAIQRELSKDASSDLHASIPDLPTSKLTPALQREIERVAAGQAVSGGIDLSRYESSTDVTPDTNVELTKSSLRSAYANMTYLRDRQTNLALLEEYGKNAWLVSNSHAEDINKHIQVELETVKSKSQATNSARKAAQEESRGELLALEETWKQGISRIVETQLATDKLRFELLQTRASSSAAHA